FSEGGIDTSQNIVTVNPDLEESANGGYNPNSAPIPGAPTPGRDDVCYLGAMDLVVRVSRSYTVWMPATDPFDAGGNPFISPSYIPATVEPRAEDQPTGTSIEIAYRGATLVAPDTEVLADAQEMDPYGDHYPEDPSPCDGSITHNTDTLNLDISFLNNDMRWFEDVSMIDGSSYYQVRVTFNSNPVSGQSPRLKALAMSWTE
ncbi:MAG: hypothetical protein GY708_26505, partial [Actinomycetia bacterium]|nr:hypothetical protein [Actinomycetes bacterium]